MITINTNIFKTKNLFYLFNNKYKRLTRFALVGVLNTAVDFGIFSLCVGVFGIYYLLAQVLGYTAGIINSFILNKFWTFESKEVNRKTTAKLIKFIIINTLSFGAALLGIRLLVHNMDMNEYIAKMITIIVSQAINFFGYKLWVFKDKMK